MYQGYLIKVGNYTIPHEFMVAGSFSAKLNTMEASAYRDGNGTLHRNTIKHEPLKVVFQTPALTGEEFDELIGNIQANFTDATQQKCTVTAYMPKQHDYVTQECYCPDFEPVIQTATRDGLVYDGLKLTFIGY